MTKKIFNGTIITEYKSDHNFRVITSEGKAQMDTRMYSPFKEQALCLGNTHFGAPTMDSMGNPTEANVCQQRSKPAVQIIPNFNYIPPFIKGGIRGETLPVWQNSERRHKIKAQSRQSDHLRKRPEQRVR